MKKEEATVLLAMGMTIEAMTTMHGGIKATITDVKTIMSQKEKKVEHMYEFDDTGEYITADEITGDKLFDMRAKKFGGISVKELEEKTKGLGSTVNYHER